MSIASNTAYAAAEVIAISTPNHSSLSVAITGASGYIGSALVDSLQQRGCRTLVVSSKELNSNTKSKKLIGSIRSLECWTEIVQFAEVIIHLAGNTSVYAAASDPTESLNSTLLPVTQLLKAASMLKRKPRVILASTATVYGLTAVLPVAESTEPKPITFYDIHKLFAECQLGLATDQGIVEGVSLRLSNVYGPSERINGATDRGILNRITAKAVRGEDIIIYGDGSHLRDYVYIDDVVNSFLAAGLAIGAPTGVFNVGSGSAVTINTAFNLVSQKIEALTGRKIGVSYASWPIDADPIELRNYAASIQKIKETFGWAPTVSLEDGVTSLIRSNQ